MADDACKKPDLETQTCDDVGGGMVRCSGVRQMCAPGSGTVLHLRFLELRLEPLMADPDIKAEILSEGITYVAHRSSNQPANSGKQTQIVIEAQSLKSGGSTDVVRCSYVVTGKPASGK